MCVIDKYYDHENDIASIANRRRRGRGNRQVGLHDPTHGGAIMSGFASLNPIDITISVMDSLKVPPFSFMI
jgi:hypothetical protein